MSQGPRRHRHVKGSPPLLQWSRTYKQRDAKMTTEWEYASFCAAFGLSGVCGACLCLLGFIQYFQSLICHHYQNNHLQHRNSNLKFKMYKSWNLNPGHVLLALFLVSNSKKLKTARLQMFLQIQKKKKMWKKKLKLAGYGCSVFLCFKNDVRTM